MSCPPVPLDAGAVLFTVASILRDVPVMPLGVRVRDASKAWYELGCRMP